MSTLLAPSVSTAAGRHPAVAPLLVAVGAFIVAVAFAWVPSVWYDEAATIVSATRSWPQLFEMLGHVDAVHGLYYAGMHLWFDLVGYSPFTLRLPSAIATGASAGLLVTLVRRLASERIALLSGVLFALLPRVTWMGTEGRSYAFTALLAIVLSLVFVIAWGRATMAARARWWILYGLLAVLSTVVFIYLAFVIAAHGLTALVTWLRNRSDWRPPLGFGIAAVVSLLLLLPFAREVAGQSTQVGWIDPLDLRIFHGVFVSQWFIGNPVFGVVGSLIGAVGVVILVSRRARRRFGMDGDPVSAPVRPSPAAPPTPGSSASPTPGSSASLTLAAIVIPWLAVPTLGLIAASALISPLYSPRYVTDATPAAGIVLAVAIAALARRRRILVAVALCVALAAPVYVAQRLPEGKADGEEMGSAWSEVASFVASKRTDAPTAIVYGPLRRHPSATTRAIAYSYPEAFAGLLDVTLKTPAAETGRLWDTDYLLSEVTNRLGGTGTGGIRTVWLVTSDKQDARPAVTATLSELGYRVDGRWSFTAVNVVRYTR